MADTAARTCLTHEYNSSTRHRLGCRLGLRAHADPRKLTSVLIKEIRWLLAVPLIPRARLTRPRTSPRSSKLTNRRRLLRQSAKLLRHLACAKHLPRSRWVPFLFPKMSV